MSLIRTILAEAWAVFVDDIGLALSAVLAIAATALIHRAGASDAVCGALLFAGLVASLLISVWRRARSKA